MTTCKTCSFFSPFPNDNRGHCKRLPPAATGIILQQEKPLQNAAGQRQVQPIALYGFPTVPESEWCGEHIPKNKQNN